MAVALVTYGGCSDSKNEPAKDRAEPDVTSTADEGEKSTVAEPRKFEVSSRTIGTAMVTMKLPESWVTDDSIYLGTGWKPAGARSTNIHVVLDCAGSCEAAEIPGNVQPIVDYKRRGVPVTGPSDPRDTPAEVEQELILDTEVEGGYLIARRFTPPKSVMDPPKPTGEVFCYRHEEDMPFFVAATGTGPVDEAGPFQDAMIEACRSLQIVEWKPEE